MSEVSGSGLPHVAAFVRLICAGAACSRSAHGTVVVVDENAMDCAPTWSMRTRFANGSAIRCKWLTLSGAVRSVSASRCRCVAFEHVFSGWRAEQRNQCSNSLHEHFNPLIYLLGLRAATSSSSPQTCAFPYQIALPNAIFAVAIARGAGKRQRLVLAFHAMLCCLAFTALVLRSRRSVICGDPVPKALLLSAIYPDEQRTRVSSSPSHVTCIKRDNNGNAHHHHQPWWQNNMIDMQQEEGNCVRANYFLSF